jgi:hypothetical protein
LAVGACLTVGVGIGAARAATPPDPLKTWSVAHIEATTIANAEQASSLTSSATFTLPGDTTTEKLGIKKGLGCTFTSIDSKTGMWKIIVIGKTVYLYLDQKYWTSVAGSAGASEYAQIHGRYMKVSSAKLASSLTPLCSVQKEFVQQDPATTGTSGGTTSSTSGGTISSSTSSSVVTVRRGTVSTLDGVRVLELKESNGVDAYITDSSRPELFEITAPKGFPGGAVIDRVNVGARFTLAAPPASDVVNGAPYGF